MPENENEATSSNDEMISVKASEYNALKNDVNHWKTWSRKHEEEVESLKKGMLVTSLISENKLPETAKEFLVGKDEEELRAKASALAAMFGSTKPAEQVEEVKPVVSAVSTTVEEVKQVETIPEIQKPSIQPNPLAGVTSQPQVSEFDKVAEAVANLFK